MFNMEVKSKGITWVDNLYQKFESMCMDVDNNLMFQETSKYVESQVQAVGINVRRFCEEVVQDLLPPPLEIPVKGPISDLSLTYGDDIGMFCKPKISLEESPPLNEKPLVPAQLEGNVSSGNDLVPRSLSNKPQEKNQDLCDKLPQNPNPAVREVTGHGCEDKKTKIDSRIVESMPALLVSKLSEEEIGGSNNSVGEEARESLDEIEHNSKAIEDLDSVEHQKICDEVEAMEVLDEIEHNSKAIEDLDSLENQKEVEGVEALNEIEHNSKATEDIDSLENQKICEEVDSKSFCVISLPTRQTKSFKKKLKEAFTTKLPSAKKNDHEELAYWYDDVDMETKVKRGIFPSLDTEKLLILDHSESDWELL